jgi:DNA relaxase NicK
MKRREQWRPVLEAEIKRWSALSCVQLTSQLADLRTYEVEFESKKYQVEVQILENTDNYVHVSVAVDDGHFWRAMRPLSSSFICRKDGSE